MPDFGGAKTIVQLFARHLLRLHRGRRCGGEADITDGSGACGTPPFQLQS